MVQGAQRGRRIKQVFQTYHQKNAHLIEGSKASLSLSRVLEMMWSWSSCFGFSAMMRQLLCHLLPLIAVRLKQIVSLKKPSSAWQLQFCLSGWHQEGSLVLGHNSESAPFSLCSYQFFHGISHVHGALEGPEGPWQSWQEFGKGHCAAPGSPVLWLPPQLQVLGGRGEE